MSTLSPDNSWSRRALPGGPEKAFSIRFHMGKVDTTANIGELTDLILERKQPV